MFWRRDVRHLANAELQKRLVEVRRQSAESEAWLDLLELALGESRDGAGWQNAAPTPPPERPVKTPLLFRAHLTVDRRTTRRYVHRLLERAELRRPRLDVAAFLEAAVCQDDARIDALAAGGDPHPLRVVAQMAVLPLLQACARATGWEALPSWWEGYCPVCGAWPALAEFRGLERKRWLRCGRCGSGISPPCRWTSPRWNAATGGPSVPVTRSRPGSPSGGAASGALPSASRCVKREQRRAAVASPRCVRRAAG